MDEGLATLKITKDVKKLVSLIDDFIGPNRVAKEDNAIFVKLQKLDEKKEYLLKVEYGDFPAGPANYFFVNPSTKKDDSTECWPTYNQNAFKTNENPRWICIAGTLAYKNHHKEHEFNSISNSINQTVFHILREINGWAAK